MKNIISNLNKLLKANGFVICANMVNHPYFNLFEEQKRFFEEYFEYEELFTELRGVGKNPIKYYKYIKK